jgi:type VI secretion system protein ImpH
MARRPPGWFAGDRRSGATASTSFLDFINLLQHRPLVLYWRRLMYRPEIRIAHGDGQNTATMRAGGGIRPERRAILG